jgi:hypothetical protein
MNIMTFFFFQKKKQKALFRFAEGKTLPKPRRSRPRGFGGFAPKKRTSIAIIVLKNIMVIFFFFQKKKQKALFRFAEGKTLPKPRRSRPRGSGGLPPENGASEV